jgi:adenosylcobinamide kinase / adenosylcobinamide-phosphate guanylyltransferase
MQGLSAKATLILGGARSGKSRFAESLVETSGFEPVYLATAQALDCEMKERIAMHRARRGPAWRTIEEPLDLAGALERTSAAGKAVLVDCLTLWISNLMLAEADFATEQGRLLAVLAGLAGPVFLVSNEVGLGIVPENETARRFRDLAGDLNQKIAAQASTVHLVVAGLPITVKQT